MRLFSFLSVLSLTVLAACGPYTDEVKLQTTNRIAMPAFMVKRDIPAGPFTLLSWERMHQRGDVASLYIEGDGVHRGLDIEADGKPVSSEQNNIEDFLLGDASPTNPVALHLASRDNAKNLAWLGRPCQYASASNEACQQPGYVTDARYAPAVIAAYHEALNEMKLRYDLTGFHLTGYDGGGAIAAILASERDDVLTLRTVAGNLDHNVATELAGKPKLSSSLNARDIAPQIANLPQHHFIGANDKVIPPAVYHSFRQGMGASQCVHYTLVQDADHTRGWVEQWPKLLNHSLKCIPKAMPEPFPELPRGYDKGYRK